MTKLLEAEFEDLHKTVADLLKNKVIESKYVRAIFWPGDYTFDKIKTRFCSWSMVAVMTDASWKRQALDFKG